jgi:hypothetical protein
MDISYENERERILFIERRCILLVVSMTVQIPKLRERENLLLPRHDLLQFRSLEMGDCRRADLWRWTLRRRERDDLNASWKNEIDSFC